MAGKKPFFTDISCPHCGNFSKMTIVAAMNDIETEYEPDEGPVGEGGDTYDLLLCPKCEKKCITKYYWHSDMPEDYSITVDVLYPIIHSEPLGLPDKILSAYRAAEKVRVIDVNAYAILMRRLLEIVCKEHGATKGTLAAMLRELADKKEIPDKLVNVAKGLKDFGNLGAHADEGELTEKEIPIVNTLSTAILEYLYSAPYLATMAEKALEKIKKKP